MAYMIVPKLKYLLQVFKNKTIELLLVAAGGGGASSNISTTSSDFDAQGLVNPLKDYRNSMKVADLTEDAGIFIFYALGKVFISKLNMYQNFYRQL